MRFLRDSKSFFTGVVFTLIITMSVMAFAEPVIQSINVAMGGIRIVVDGVTIKPVDGKGSPVEPLIYNGTTYLPVRALNDALTKGMKPVEWDGVNKVVYIGEKKPVGVVRLDTLKPVPISGIQFNDKTSFSTRQIMYNPFNDFRAGSGHPQTSGLYLLNKNYTKMTGYLAVSDIDKYSSLGDGPAHFVVYSYNRDKDVSSVVYETDFYFFKDPVPFEVSLSEVDEMKFVITNDYPAESWSDVKPYNAHAFNIELTAAQ